MEVADEPQTVADSNPATDQSTTTAPPFNPPTETKAVAAAAPLAFRALWAIIARFFKGLFGGGAKTDKT